MILFYGKPFSIKYMHFFITQCCNIKKVASMVILALSYNNVIVRFEVWTAGGKISKRGLVIVANSHQIMASDWRSQLRLDSERDLCWRHDAPPALCDDTVFLSAFIPSFYHVAFECNKENLVCVVCIQVPIFVNKQAPDIILINLLL